MDRKIKPDFNCYQIMMNLLSHHKNTENSDLTISTLIRDLKSKSTQDLTVKQWYCIINSLSMIGDIKSMMNEYYNMISNGIKLNPFILTALSQGVINGG